MTEEFFTSELQARMAQGELFNLVDVRELDEWEAGHVAEAQHVPLSQFTERMNEIDFSREPIYFICRSGARSGRVCSYLAQEGYEVINVQGGMLGWTGEQVTGS